MIVVVADDLSGAAELAGAALRHGLTAEVQTNFDERAASGVICVDTDSRSLAPAAAAAVVAEVTRRVSAAKPAWIYKKCDSVLRGHVLTETQAMLAVLNLRSAMIVPANPARGRVIRHGCYFVGEQPLHETVFARDPEHPRTTSRVADLLRLPGVTDPSIGSARWPAGPVGPASVGELDSIVVPDAASAADVAAHAASVADDKLAVGGVDFFEALLRRKLIGCTGADRGIVSGPSMTPSAPRSATLLVCGSAASWPARREVACAAGVPWFELPHAVAAVAAAFSAAGGGLIGIGDGVETRGRSATELVRLLAETVRAVMGEVEVNRLLLEGGATAAAVVRALGWSRLHACEVTELGIGILAPAEAARLRVFIKPGSYAWPGNLWPGPPI